MCAKRSKRQSDNSIATENTIYCRGLGEAQVVCIRCFRAIPFWRLVKHFRAHVLCHAGNRTAHWSPLPLTKCTKSEITGNQRQIRCSEWRNYWRRAVESCGRSFVMLKIELKFFELRTQRVESFQGTRFELASLLHFKRENVLIMALIVSKYQRQCARWTLKFYYVVAPQTHARPNGHCTR